MANATCAVPECGRAVRCRGYCDAHYQRVRKYGDPQAWKPLRSTPQAVERDDVVGRILARSIRLPDGCIEWNGYRYRTGYGLISWRGRKWLTHRAIWTALVGPIPDDDDWTIDHLCRNRACVNVGHMQVVTRTVNSERGGGLTRAQETNRSALACKNGHPYPPAVALDSRGYRVCLPCKREKWARQKDQVNEQRRQRYAEKRAAGIDWQEARLA